MNETFYSSTGAIMSDDLKKNIAEFIDNAPTYFPTKIDYPDTEEGWLQEQAYFLGYCHGRNHITNDIRRILNKTTEKTARDYYYVLCGGYSYRDLSREDSDKRFHSLVIESKNPSSESHAKDVLQIHCGSDNDHHLNFYKGENAI